MEERDTALYPIVGQGASAGHGRGVVRAALSLPEARAAPPGAVLLVERLAAAWVPLLAAPAAVVSVEGGALSTAATCLRERGIPAVAGV
jgi:phosphohistidine swiveling domain-containing protein